MLALDGNDALTVLKARTQTLNNASARIDGMSSSQCSFPGRCSSLFPVPEHIAGELRCSRISVEYVGKVP